MSHYTTLPTQIVDTAALCAALGDLGFSIEKIECHTEPQQHVYPYPSR